MLLFVIIIKSTRWSANSSLNHSYFSFGIICGRLWGSLAVEDHFRSILGIICGWGSFAVLYSSLFFKEIWNNGRRSEAMDVWLRVLKESNKSRFGSYSVRNSVLIISHITFRDCRVHIFSDNLSRNICIRKGNDFASWSILKGREICHLGLLKGPIGLIDEWYGFKKSRKRSVFKIAWQRPSISFSKPVERGW